MPAERIARVRLFTFSFCPDRGGGEQIFNLHYQSLVRAGARWNQMENNIRQSWMQERVVLPATFLLVNDYLAERAFSRPDKDDFDPRAPSSVIASARRLSQHRHIPAPVHRVCLRGLSFAERGRTMRASKWLRRTRHSESPARVRAEKKCPFALDFLPEPVRLPPSTMKHASFL